MPALAIDLVPPARSSAKDFALSAIYTNTGTAPLALTFWWNRSLRIVDRDGRLVSPGPGPVLPCGVVESWRIVMPGGRLQRAEPLACTQPAGQSATIGWSYALSPGMYWITLVLEAPPSHGFSQSEFNQYAFRGRVESSELAVEIT